MKHTGTKRIFELQVLLRNLDAGVDTRDLEEMRSSAGQLLEATLSYSP